MSPIGNRYNYKQLLDRHGMIRIPMIQRDYAQGRPSAAQVRDEFLSALETKLLLPADDPSLPMNLDFVYGSVTDADGLSQFDPLDGQQRLTTLFLLHWYTAWNDNRFSDFLELFTNGDHSRFSYKVRQSSNEFFDALVKYVPDTIPDAVPLLSDLITNQPWFFRSWRLDPTVQSVLCMLDAIHLRFAGSSNLYDRLIDENRPSITFQLLDLENFGLSDDLYIKMNARGVPLTPFETFKARYEQELEGQFGGLTRKIGEHNFPIREFVARRMDTNWFDLFWAENRKAASFVDESMFNVFRLLALVTRDPENEDCLKYVTMLTRESPNYSAFHDNGWLDEEFSRTLIAVLEQWASGTDGLRTLLPNSDYFDERNVFTKLTNSSTSLAVSEILLFMAYVDFIREHEESLDPDKLNQWLRVVHNLIINSNIDRVERLPMGMSVIRALLPSANEILQNLQAGNLPSTFPPNVKNQADEEILKAKLLLGDDGWRRLIDRAELHGYFRGQIEFLMDFSGILSESKTSAVETWNAETHRTMQSAFEKVLKKAEGMFDQKGLIETNEHLWERALITVGDYLLESGGRNKSLLVNAATDQASWKRLLRGFTLTERTSREHLRNLWAKLDDAQPFSPQLKKIISSGGLDVDKWRAAFAKTPVLWNYGVSRMVRFADGNIYLLKRTQMNGAHVELFSYCFYNNELQKMKEKGLLDGSWIPYYEEVIKSEDEPYIIFINSQIDQHGGIAVDYVDGRYRLWVLSNVVEEIPPLKQTLEDLGELEVLGDYFRVGVAPSKLQKTLIKATSAIEQSAGIEQ